MRTNVGVADYLRLLRVLHDQASAERCPSELNAAMVRLWDRMNGKERDAVQKVTKELYEAKVN